MVTSAPTSAKIKMDGPIIPWTVADLFHKPPKLAMAYHVVSAGYDALNPMGALLGGGLGLVRGNPVVAMARGGLVGGGLGMVVGAAGMYSKSLEGDALKPLPWNDEGIATRVAGVQTNYKVRTLDLSVWTGMAIAGVLYSRGVIRAGGSLLNCLSLGSAVGGLSGFAFIGYTEYQMNKALNDGED